MSRRKLIVLDTSVLMNLGNIDRFELLVRLHDIHWVFLDEAEGEILHGDALPRFHEAKVRGWITAVELTHVSGLARFAQLRTMLGVGEAQALAYAECMDAVLACDDRRKPFPEIVRQTIPEDRLVGTVDIYLALLERGLISTEFADADKAALAGRKFAMKHATFADMLPRVSL